MTLALEHWHIEVSSICSLKCPRCPRAELPETLLNHQLTLQFFQERIGEDIIKQMKKITFCGNDGDPIYCREFIEICRWIRQVNPNIAFVLITNGSYKTVAWWQELAGVFNENDQLHWSIDGWNQLSNDQYRVNSNWMSILNGISTFRAHNSSTYRIWAAIAFRFNESMLDDMSSKAGMLGFDAFQLTKSSKFGSRYAIYGINDPLEPTDTGLVSSSHRYTRTLTKLTDKKQPGTELKTLFFERSKQLLLENKHFGVCLVGNKGVFLNSRGEFYPCCWTANRFEHNKEWTDRAATSFNLNQTTMAEILQLPFWKTTFLEFSSVECKLKCTKERLTDLEHATEW